MNNIEKNDLVNYENSISKKQILRSQDEIISKWSEDPSIPIISIFCATYNQELYIEDTIRGFLIQETDFPFEVLIHDDASTDGTPQIIKKYENAYPRIIKPIYQKNNQYSKGIKISSQFQLPRARGKFIAFCEGDDFWIDAHKLKKQVSALKGHPNINICFSPGLSVYSDGSIQSFCKHTDRMHIFSVGDVIEGDGDFMPTCSLLIRKEVFNNIPQWFRTTAPVADYFMQILGSIDNGALYIPDYTCAYRVNTPGSWSVRTSKSSAESIFNKTSKTIYCLKQIDVETNYRYTDSIKHVCSTFYLRCSIRFIDEGQYSKAKDLISKSWAEKKNLNYKQIVLKRLIILSPLFHKYRLAKKYINSIKP